MPPCPCCAATLQALITRKDKYTLLSCPRCSFITSSPLPTTEELNQFYQGYLFNVPKGRKKAPEEDAGTNLSVLEDVKKIVGDLHSQGMDKMNCYTKLKYPFNTY